MSHPHSHSAPASADRPTLDLRERGLPVQGEPQFLDRRLFMQLLWFDCTPAMDATALLQRIGTELQGRKVPGVLYEDANNPYAVALLSWSEDPAHFPEKVRPVLQEYRSFLRLRPRGTMVGRTYSTGFESDLNFWMLQRPVETVLNAECNWHIWYPLRRKGPFERLEAAEKGQIMREHGEIGRAYGEANHAHDVRLACHGLDENDNDFLIGLIGKDLFPLSHVVQNMRRTRQTAEHMDQMGPFFVGRAVWRGN